MITGAHAIIYSADPEADRVFLRDVLGFPHVDAGGGWLIFALPPSEVAIHPAGGSDAHELYLMCDDMAKFRGDMKKAGVRTEAVVELRWGSLTRVELPGGGKLGVYQPKHASPSWKAQQKPKGRVTRRRPLN